jgi:hypothetical protein
VYLCTGTPLNVVHHVDNSKFCLCLCQVHLTYAESYFEMNMMMKQ